MTKQETDFIESRSWYQTINFTPNISSKGCDWCGDPAWDNIKKLLPNTLNGCRVLDLGCNAGLFCVRARLLHAKKCIGVDWPGWRPKWDFAEQRRFVLDVFGSIHGEEWSGIRNSGSTIEFEENKMEAFLRDYQGPHFDYVFAIASIYYTEDPEEVVENITRIGKHVILRIRDENRISRFCTLFENKGYKLKNSIHEKWWEKLNEPTDDFYLFAYSSSRKYEYAYYYFQDYHEDICGSSLSLNIWQIMELVGSEAWDIFNYAKKFPPGMIKNIPLKNFIRHKKGKTRLDQENIEGYKWHTLANSIKEKGIIIPVIAEPIEDGLYICLEGRHRLSALSLIEPFNHDYLVPTIIVRKDAA